MVALSTELRSNLAVAAHLAHVSYAGSRDETGKVVPRYRITMASALDEATCRRVNLGFMDHRSSAAKITTLTPTPSSSSAPAATSI